MWAGRKRWWTEQWPFHSSSVADLRVPSSSPPEVEPRIPHGHVVLAVAEIEARVAAQVLIGKEEDLVAAARPPPSAPRAHVRTARALDDVHTTPPWRPTNALSAAEEFM